MDAIAYVPQVCISEFIAQNTLLLHSLNLNMKKMDLPIKLTQWGRRNKLPGRNISLCLPPQKWCKVWRLFQLYQQYFKPFLLSFSLLLPGINFINVYARVFCTNFFCAKSYKAVLLRVRKFWYQTPYEKRALKRWWNWLLLIPKGWNKSQILIDKSWG